jgi:hypothetical protein
MIPQGVLTLLLAVAGLAVAASTPPAAPAGEVAARAGVAETPVLVDADGQVVGPLLVHYNSPAGIVRIVRGDLDVPVQVRASSFLEAFARVGFESGDCTGPPWLVDLLPTTSPPFFRAAGVGPASVLYVGEGPRATPTISSKWTIPPGDPAGCQPQAAAAQEALQAVEALDLSIFRPPFRIR